ncbi:Yop proteins translocation protein D [Pseudovibrio sp. FO-BEG1]|uniref:FHA domain-containing protein n=1 Tax=Pseudovibrio sp. (strain FO-BEG1) TaxID=911045 RepID=UPI000238BF98|nr:FHA domain-containing protein [Pseudovibrio sp. FO-BEG1]AEV38219.1 Yop proteins translocation protein D [Pseudovibrio sp. FO-BEG1]
MGKLILKILVGQQAGAEVMLEPGEYTLGSDRNDDLQIADLSVAAGHMQLRLQDNKIEISAKTGDIRTENGVSLNSGDDEWVEIEPLDVINIGVVKIALGAKNAQWATLSKALNAASEGENEKAENSAANSLLGENSKHVDAVMAPLTKHRKRIALATVASAVVLGGFYLVGSGKISPRTASALPNGGIEAVRVALADLPFAESLSLRQDVDDQIYLTGYVSEPVQRRAITEAVERTAVPVRLRVRVIETLKKDIAGYLQSRGSNISFALADDGELTLSGSVLDKAEADQLIADLRGLNGISSVTSKIKTADDYLLDVRKLAKRALIDDTIIFRLDDKTLEVSGIIASQDIDRWSGFLRSYSRQYASVIPLRSLVKLVQENGQVVDLKANFDGGIEPLLAAVDPKTNEPVEERQTKVLELARAIKQQDGFAPERRGTKSSSRVAKQNDNAEADKPDAPATPLQKATERLLSSISISSAQASTSPTETPEELKQVEPTKVGGATDKGVTKEVGKGKVTPQSKVDARFQSIALDDPELNEAAEVVFLAWMKSAESKTVPEDLKKKFLPLLVTPPSEGPLCSDDLSVPVSQIPVTVLWLDILSSSESLSLTTFPDDRQRYILEAAVNPAATRDCLIKAELSNKLGLVPYSNFIRESLRNPEFISFLTRDLNTPSLTVSGASLIGERYVLSDTNKRYKKGQSINQSSRLVAVGELGALVREYEGYSVAIYGDQTAWVVREANAKP